LDIKPLLDLTCKTVANMIKAKSPEEIRKTFNITNDFTPEEEDQVRRENGKHQKMTGMCFYLADQGSLTELSFFVSLLFLSLLVSSNVAKS